MPPELELPDCPREGEGPRHSWIFGSANRCAKHYLSESVRLIRERLTREPTPINEVEKAVHKAFSEALDQQAFLRSIQRRTPAASEGSVLTKEEESALAAESRRRAWPNFLAPSEKEIEQIAHNLGVISLAVHAASRRELLYCTASIEGPAFVVCDHEHRVALARRLDGKPWEKTNSIERLLPGSDVDWPVGLDKSQKPILLGVGLTGLLWLEHLAWVSGLETAVTVVVLPSRKSKLAHEALEALRNRKIVVFERTASDQWLLTVTARLFIFKFNGYRRDDGSEVKNLGDLVRVDPATWEIIRRDLAEIATPKT